MKFSSSLRAAAGGLLALASGCSEPTRPNPPVSTPVWDHIFVARADGSGITRLTSGDLPASSPSWSPDGRKIAFVSAQGGSEIFVMDADGSNQAQLTKNSTQDSRPRWSPDGRSIVFTSDAWVSMINAEGTGERRLIQGLYPAWSPDGSKIAFQRLGETFWEAELGGGISVMDADGTRPVELAWTGANFP